MAIGKHEGCRGIQLSKDGSASRINIFTNLPKGNFTFCPLLIGSKTILTSGIEGKPVAGIWRSEDEGKTWAQVSDLNPSRAPTLTSKGVVFYPVKGGGLARSKDAGKTWTMLKGPTTGSVIELPDGRLAATGGTIFLSKDNGDTWTAFGPKLPAGPSGWGPSLVYLPGRRAFMICSMAWNKKIPNAVWRLDIP